MRNALREILIRWGLPMNRHRLHNESQLAVEVQSFPDAEKYADDFLFGFMVVDPDVKKKFKDSPAKRSSIFFLNMAVALTPYRFDATLHQSPLNAGSSPWKNSPTSALIHREVAYTAYQYPFSLPGQDVISVKQGPEWAQALLKAISELSGVAGSHARSLFEMSPKSIVVRTAHSLIHGMDLYGFNEKGGFPGLDRLREGDLPPNEFWIGGDLARTLDSARKSELISQGAHFFDNPQVLLEKVGLEAFGKS